MLVIFAVIIGGIITGRLLSSRRLVFVSGLITVIIWTLLFLLGLEVGSDPAVVGGMATLGRTAFVIFVFSVAGSIGASWLLWRRIRGHAVSGAQDGGVSQEYAGSVSDKAFGADGKALSSDKISCVEGAALSANKVYDAEGAAMGSDKVPGAEGTDLGADKVWKAWGPDFSTGAVADETSGTHPDPALRRASSLPATPDSAACKQTPSSALASDSEKPLSMWGALKGSLVIVAFFVAGCVAGLFDVMPFDAAGSRVSTYVLYALMFCVGVTLGHDKTLAGRVRRLDPRLALLPVMTAVGTLAGAAVATPLLQPLGVSDTLAVGAGFGYYSLSSIFIADFRGAELGTVALLCNVMREIFTLLAAPLVARWFGPLAAVSIGGATTFDTTLPIITQAAGKPYAVISIFHGCMLDFSVPFLVTFFCTL